MYVEEFCYKLSDPFPNTIVGYFVLYCMIIGRT